MAPPSATEPTPTPASIPSHSHTNGHDKPSSAPHEPGLNKAQAEGATVQFPHAPTFADKYKEREYQKGRLALAFRIFAKLGFDEGVAGHITLRVSSSLYLGIPSNEGWRGVLRPPKLGWM